MKVPICFAAEQCGRSRGDTFRGADGVGGEGRRVGVEGEVVVFT